MPKMLITIVPKEIIGGDTLGTYEASIIEDGKKVEHASGKTDDEALGRLVRLNPKIFGVKIKYKK